MTTSLAEQLQRLAIPQTTALKHDKKRPSLLFDPKEAAKFSRETFYQIGLEGLEELIQKNQMFSEFKNTLFHLNSKEFERSVQDIEANKKLNKNLKKFIILLSPYFMLNCSHKALEWLINRFYIHEYNREELIMLCLPFHESNIFIRMIQLLKFKEKGDSFYFLKELQLQGTHLPKQSLLNHAASNNNFLKFVSKYIKELLKTHSEHYLLTVAFNFYCTVFTGALEYNDEITEDQVSQMLQLLLKGLNSPVADFCAASYVITARLVSKTNLSNKLLDTFVEKISEVTVPGLKTEACLLLIVIYQSQKQYKSFTPIAIASLSEKEWLPKVLTDLQNSGSYIYPFLESLIKSFSFEGVNNDFKLARDMVKACLDYLRIKDEFVSTVLHCILDAVHPKMNISMEAKEWLIETIQTIENQYPTLFDKAVYAILSNSMDKKSKRRKCLTKLLKNSMTFKGKFDIFAKLYHPSPSIRGEAIKFLLADYDNLKDTEKEMINACFIDRLRSQDVNVVKDTLKIINKTFKIEQNSLKKLLAHLVIKYLKDKQTWGIIYKDITNMLFTLYPPNDWEVFLIIFPLLLPLSSEDVPNAKKLLETPFISNHDLFKPNIPKLKSTNDAESFNKLILKSLSRNTDFQNVKSFIEVLKQIPDESWDNYHKYVSFLILSTIIPENSTLEVGSMIHDFLLMFYNQVGEKYNAEKSISNYLKEAIMEKFPVQGFLKCLIKLTYKIKKPLIDLKFRDFSIENTENRYFLSVTNILLDNNIEYFKKFLKRFFQSKEEEVEFLINLCLCENTILDCNFKLKALTHVKNTLLENEDAKCMIYIEKSLSMFLLVLLSNPDETIRQIIVDIFIMLVNVSTRKGNSFYYLLSSIIKYKEEILLDHEQVPLVLFNIIDPTNTKNKKNARDLNLIRNQMLKVCCEEQSPSYLKSGILKVLSCVNTFGILEETSKLSLSILQKNELVVKSFNAKIILYSVAKINCKVINQLNFETYTWKFIETFIKNDKTVIYNDVDDKISPSPLVLNRLDREIFIAIVDVEVIKKLLDTIVEMSVTAQNSNVLPAAIKIFKHIDLDSEWIKEQLIMMREVQSPKIDATKKKRRIGLVPTVDILDTLEWKKGVTVLEFIQDKKKIRNPGTLLPILFDILKRCLDFDEQSSVEYPKQLLLSLILHCCKKTEEKIPDSVFNIELIVQCIRASQNPQTHYHALLVLAHIANLVPTQVLHHMMAIFTFMGSSVLRHDDSYSFQIIFKIIDTIIPIIVSEDAEGQQTCNISKVLRVFVDALLDVPEHRRMPLLKHLLEKISVKENLFLFLLLIFEAQVTLPVFDKQRKDGVQKRLDIASDFCKQFPPEIVIYTSIKLMKYLQGLPDENEENMEVDDLGSTIFNISTHTPKDFRHYKYILVKFTGNLLGSPEFVNLVAALNDEEEMKLEPLFKDLIVSILQYIQRISKVAEKSANTPQSQYWKVMLHLSYDILDSVNALVTSQMFLLVTKGLMVHTLSTVRRRTLELLNNKLQYNSQYFDDCDNNGIYSLIPPIVTIIEGVKEEVDSEQETIIQTALLSLKLLTKSLAWQEPEKFVQILEFVTGILNYGKAQHNVLASVVLCLAELCTNLKGHAISSLPEFMPALIKILKKQNRGDASSVLLRSLITTIEKILDSMPLFLSPYLEKLLTELSILMSKWTVNEKEHEQIQPFMVKLGNIKEKIGSTIPLRVLLPSVESCYNNLIRKTNYNACCSLMDILAQNISNASGSDINSNFNELTNFFLDILKFRTDVECSLEEANVVENNIIETFTVLVLKLSEHTFRPLYYKLYDWAIRSEVKSDRIITFYSLSSKIAQSLKGLFVLFAGHFINNSTQILDACNKVKNDELYFDNDCKNILLLENVVKTLDAVFLYDSQKFVNRDRFDILMQPLVDQLENSLGGLDELMKRNEILIIPCLVHFSIATADDALWKQMNYQILLKMRNNSPKIRLATLHYLTEFVRKLGEDFLPLLAETIPFLAELLEDEEEEVEKACQKAVQEMEKILGEPLQKYF